MLPKVTHIGKYFPPDKGGIESVTDILVRGALRARHAVNVICFGAGTRVDLAGMAKVERFPIAAMLASQPLGWGYFKAACRAFRNCDVAHVHLPNLLASGAALTAPRRTAVVLHWHSDIIGKGVLGLLLRPLELACLVRADRIIATSSPYLRGSSLLRKFEYKTVVIPIGIPDPTDEARASSLPPDIASFIGGRRLILSVGRVTAYKGYEHLVEASSSIDEDACIIVVGSGDNSALLKQVDTQGVADRILFAGGASEETLHALYQAASIFCLPSIYRSEAFGVVLLEAMAFGLPLVTCDIVGSGVSWVNSENVSGLVVPPANASALASACNRLLRSDSLRIELAAGARQRYLDEFTEQKFVNDTIRQYAEMTAYKRRLSN